MPISAPKPCTTCGTLVRDGGSRCQAHKLPAWTKREPTRRITGRKLQRMRQDLFARQPLCEPCERAGRVRLATIRDHRVPLAEGGPDDVTNEQAICAECHERKSQAEAMRGRMLGIAA